VENPTFQIYSAQRRGARPAFSGCLDNLPIVAIITEDNDVIGRCGAYPRRNPLRCAGQLYCQRFRIEDT